eukprot:3776278-Pleurochrysis_carterae.AAC.2
MAPRHLSARTKAASRTSVRTVHARLASRCVSLGRSEAAWERTGAQPAQRMGASARASAGASA